MKIFKYNSYDEYKKTQIDANKRKIHYSYVDPNSIELLCDYVCKDLNIVPNNILCHGTRQGKEIKYFKEYLRKYEINSKIIGTDISPTASNFDDTIQWDFHEIKDEWIGKYDLIYSNSFDHSPYPQKCLKSWMSCINPDGICIIEYSEECDAVNSKVDPFGATLDEYKDLIQRCGFNLVDLLDNSGIEDLGETHKGERIFLIIGHGTKTN